MQELHVFGYARNAIFTTETEDSEDAPGAPVSSPKCAVRAESIKVVWASWCDLILTINDTYHYYGTSLSATQSAAILAIPYATATPPIFFGRRDSTGLLGFILPSQNLITIFHTPEEISKGNPPVSIYSLSNTTWNIRAIDFTSSDTAFVTLQSRADPSEGAVFAFPSLSHFEADVLSRMNDPSLTTPSHPTLNHLRDTYPIAAPFLPQRSASNSASLTLLDPNARIHTLLSDTRFPRSAGRDADDEEVTQTQRSNSAFPVPFLEETAVRSVAAGGLYTAAISADGELFLWGQAYSGAEGEIAVFKDGEEDGDGGDEYVKIAEVGDGARVVDVGVGFGHVVVALEGGGSGDGERVFVAGDHWWGALGLGSGEEGVGFAEEFREVEGLDGKKVRQVECAGWSSFVVVEAEE